MENFTRNTEWNGLPAVSFGAGGFEGIIIPGTGANLLSLENRERKLSILRTPSSADQFLKRPTVWGIPFLFPPNRIADGTFTAPGNGKTYRFPITDTARNNHLHGFLKLATFEAVRAEASSDTAVVELAYRTDEKTPSFEHFPHKYEVRVLYELSERGLSQHVSIKNNGPETMPLGFGCHTALRVPFRTGADGSACRLFLSAGKRWNLNERLLPSGAPVELSPGEKRIRTEGLPVTDELLMLHCTAAPLEIGGRQFHGAILEDRPSGLKVVYEVDRAFGHWVVWNGEGEFDFVCPEPQTWATNAPNLDLPAAVTGYRELEPGKTLALESSLRVEFV